MSLPLIRASRMTLNQQCVKYFGWETAARSVPRLRLGTIAFFRRMGPLSRPLIRPVRLFVRDNDPKLQKSITAFEGLVVYGWPFEVLEVELSELLLRLGRLPSAHPD